MGGFRNGGLSNSRFALKPDVAIGSEGNEVSILSKNSLAITDFPRETQHVQRFENPHSRFHLALPLRGQFGIEIGSNQETDVESMSNR